MWRNHEAMKQWASWQRIAQHLAGEKNPADTEMEEEVESH